jgi:serine/threonine-protein kinase
VNVTLAAGTIFAGRYRIVGPIAAGGMGAVYEAVHVETERRRALKVMHPHLFQSAEMCERFKQEARIAAHVESEHIVDVSDAGVDEATQMPFLVMELLRGEELSKRLKRLRRLPPAEVVVYLQQTALALDRTHASNIVHRDLKPENLFLTQREDGSPRVKILDFGIAKLVREGTAGSTQSMGTPLYMAPEQYRAGVRLSPGADIYALGMIAYTLLVGEPYWRRDLRSAGDVIAFALVAIHGPQEAASLRAAATGVTLPPAFDAWFARATALDPERRFTRASEATQALAEAVRSMTLAAPLPAAETTIVAVTTVPNLITAPPPSVDAVTHMLTPATPVPRGSITAAPITSSTTAPGQRRATPILAAAVAAGVAIGLGGWLWGRADLRGPAGQAAPPPSVTAEIAATAPPSSVTAGPSVSPAPAASSAVAPAASVAVPASSGSAKPLGPALKTKTKGTGPLPLIGRD